MIKKRKIIIAILLIISFILVSMTAYAKNMAINVTFDGKNIAMTSEDPNTTWTIDNFLPGDSDTSSVTISNTGAKSVSVDTDISIEEDDGLVEAINLKVTNSAGEEVFNGSYTDFETITKDMMPGDTETYTVVTSLDVSAGNEYQGRQYKLQFKFTASAYVPKGTLTVRYVDKDTGEEIEPSTVDTKEISERYNLPEQGKNIPGWKFVPPAEGTLSDYYKEEGSTVTYKYEKIKYGKVTVKHIVDDEFEEDGTTNKVLKEDSDIKEVGTQYSFQPESFAGYEFANKIEGGNSGIYEEEDKTVIFHYKKVEEKETGKVIILYVDENGKELERKVSTDVVGEGYSFQETDIIKDIPGYKYITYEGELTGEYKKEDTIIYCKYESIKYGNLIVLCIDENNNIIKRTVTTMEVGTNYNLGEVGEEIPGYEFLGVEGETAGKYKLEDTIVTYRYKHKKSEPSTSEVTKPKTGDVITKYIGIAAGAVVVLIILLVIGKKRNKDDK